MTTATKIFFAVAAVVNGIGLLTSITSHPETTMVWVIATCWMVSAASWARAVSHWQKAARSWQTLYEIEKRRAYGHRN